MGAIRNKSVSTTADVSIRRGRIPARLADATETGPDWQLTGDDRFLFSVPGLARFLVAAGREITVELEQDAKERDASAFVLGTAFGVLLHQRGSLVLHGSAVANNDRAIAICGESGAGKSTLAAALCRHGCRFVTDDLCVVALNERRQPIVLPDGRQLKLWKESIQKLGLAARQGAAVHESFEKYYVEPFDAAVEPTRLSAIYVLREGNPPLQLGIETLALPDAMRMLEIETYRPGLRAKMGRMTESISHAAATVAHAKVFLLTRPRRFEHLNETVALLCTHWDSLG